MNGITASPHSVVTKYHRTYPTRDFLPSNVSSRIPITDKSYYCRTAIALTPLRLLPVHLTEIIATGIIGTLMLSLSS
jgi:hypothetical protein